MSFSSSPSTATLGDRVKLSYEVRGADAVHIEDSSGHTLLGSSPELAGSVRSLPIESEVTFTLLATRDAKQATASVTVGVQPGPLPVRIIRFEVTPRSIRPGQSATLQWAVENTESVEVKQAGGETLVPAGREFEGSLSVSPVLDSTYRLIANSLGGPVVREVTLQVEDTSEIISFSSAPPTIDAGESSILSYEIINCARARITGKDNRPISDQALTSSMARGQATVTPDSTEMFTLTVWNGAGEQKTRGTQVTVRPARAASITSFTPNSASVEIGQPVTLNWVVRDARSGIEISSDGSVLHTSNSLEGSFTTTPERTGPIQYQLLAKDPSGNAQQSITIGVDPLPVTFVSFSANPMDVPSGGSSTLSWEVTNADSVEIRANGSSVYNSSANIGSTELTVSATTSYTLEASNSRGRVEAAVQVTVWREPSIAEFRVPPTFTGSSIEISWVALDATRAALYVDGSTVAGFPGDPEGTFQLTLLQSASLQLRAVNPVSEVWSPMFLAERVPRCGDGATELPEECDDGNIQSGDGCSSTCFLEVLCGAKVLGSVTGENLESGITFGNPDNLTSSCAPATASSEATFAWTAPHAGTFWFQALRGFYAVATIYDDPCQPAELACATQTSRSKAVVALSEGQRVLIAIESEFNGSSTGYELAIGEVYCGSGYVDSGEVCDDGNQSDGDGCSSTCELECPFVDGWLDTHQTLQGTTTGADARHSLCGESPDRSYLFKAPRDGEYMFEVDPQSWSAFETIAIQVAEPSCVLDPPSRACEGGDESRPPRVYMHMEQDELATVVVDGWGETGGFYVRASQFECVNTDLGSALGIGVWAGSSYIGQDLYRYCDYRDPDDDFNTSDIAARWVAPAAGNYIFDLRSTGGDIENSDGVLAVYDGVCNLDSLRSCSISFAGFGEPIAMSLVQGQVLTIVVDSGEWWDGQFSIDIYEANRPTSCPVADLGSALGLSVVQASAIGGTNNFTVCGARPDVSYVWTAPSAGNYAFYPDHSSDHYNSSCMVVLDGVCGGSPLGSWNGFDPVVVPLDAGQQITIVVDGGGVFDLGIRSVP